MLKSFLNSNKVVKMCRLSRFLGTVPRPVFEENFSRLADSNKNGATNVAINLEGPEWISTHSCTLECYRRGYMCVRALNNALVCTSLSLLLYTSRSSRHVDLLLRFTEWLSTQRDIVPYTTKAYKCRITVLPQCSIRPRHSVSRRPNVPRHRLTLTFDHRCW